jgi:hypothetical protein
MARVSVSSSSRCDIEQQPHDQVALERKHHTSPSPADEPPCCIRIFRQIAPDSGLSFMALMLRIKVLQHKKPLFLHCAAISSGGSYRLVHTLWRPSSAVTASPRWAARWSAGGLLDDDGSLLAGGIKTARVESKEV